MRRLRVQRIDREVHVAETPRTNDDRAVDADRVDQEQVHHLVGAEAQHEDEQ